MADGVEHIDVWEETQIEEEALMEQPILIDRAEARARIWEVSAQLYSMAQDAARWARTPGVTNRRSLETFQVKTMLEMSKVDATDIYREPNPQGILDHYLQRASNIRRDWHALHPVPEPQVSKKEEPEPHVSKKEEPEPSQVLKKEEPEPQEPPAKKPCKSEDESWDNE